MMGMRKVLPYPMQLGSGTYDLTLGYSFQRYLTIGHTDFNLMLQKDLIIIVKIGDMAIEENCQLG